MITKSIQCPNCQNTITVQGEPGQQMIVTCPKCNTKGGFTFPHEQQVVRNSISGENAYGIYLCILNLNKVYNNSIKKDK